jgi:hypothetical protein
LTRMPNVHGSNELRAVSVTLFELAVAY